MREIQKLLAFTANKCPIPVLLGLVLCLTAWQCGCKVKSTEKHQVPQNILNAKTAGYDELLELIASYNTGYTKITTLSSLRLKLAVERKISDETSERWKTASGYISLKRPDSVRLVLRSPLGTEVDMASIGDDFCVWIPSKNGFYIGKNSAKELVSEGFAIPMRASHLFDAILPQNIKTDTPEIRISMEEARDADSKYYIISFYKDAGSRRIHTVRRMWIERSKMVICRQQFFLEDGRVESDIAYSNIEKTNGLNLPLKIHLDRPLEGYALTMEFGSESWRINGDLPDNAFVLSPPQGAEIIHLKEKTRNGAP